MVKERRRCLLPKKKIDDAEVSMLENDLDSCLMELASLVVDGSGEMLPTPTVELNIIVEYDNKTGRRVAKIGRDAYGSLPKNGNCARVEALQARLIVNALRLAGHGNTSFRSAIGSDVTIAPSADGDYMLTITADNSWRK